MGARSFIVTICLVVLCLNVFYFSSSQDKGDAKYKHHKVKRNPTGGPINGYSVIAPVAPRSEFELERRYDMVECSQTNGAIRNINNKQFQIECGVIHSGDPVYTDTGKTFDDCLTTCASDRRCVALAFEEVDTKRCYLYDKLPPPRITRGARHTNWLGAKVLNPDDNPQTPVCTQKSLSLSEGNALGYTCNTALKYAPDKKRAVAIVGGTVDSCIEGASDITWDFFVWVPWDNACEYYLGDLKTHDCEIEEGGLRVAYDKGCYYDSCETPAPKPCTPASYNQQEGEARGQICDKFLSIEYYWWDYKVGSMTGSVDDCGRTEQPFEWVYFIHDGTKCWYWDWIDKSGEWEPWYGNQYKIYAKLCFKTCPSNSPAPSLPGRVTEEKR